LINIGHFHLQEFKVLLYFMAGFCQELIICSEKKRGIFLRMDKEIKRLHCLTEKLKMRDICAPKGVSGVCVYPLALFRLRYPFAARVLFALIVGLPGGDVAVHRESPRHASGSADILDFHRALHGKSL
jgi:hypothetical protein